MTMRKPGGIGTCRWPQNRTRGSHLDKARSERLWTAGSLPCARLDASLSIISMMTTLS